MSAHEEIICQFPCQKDDYVCCTYCQKIPIEIAEENIQEIMMDWKKTKEERSNDWSSKMECLLNLCNISL
jgi:hypothetical protein